MSRWIVAWIVIGWSGVAVAQRWQDATSRCLGATGEWTNKVALADLDKDGDPDLLLANGGDYRSPGTPQATRVWRNDGGWIGAGPHCTEISAQAVGGFVGLARVVEVADLDGDGDVEILTGGAWQTQLRMYAQDAGTWTDASARLPQQMTSIGDVAIGDVDGDRDLDLLLAEWGTGAPQTAGYLGGRTRLYLNDGQGTFTDATATKMPSLLVKWSWDVELADVDGDYDLDALIACKSCTTSYLFRNDGTGTFADDPDAIPHFGNNYDFEAMDADADGDLDLVTINDGPSLREHLLINDGSGKFTDETAARLAGAGNPADADDNQAIWLDADADGDADLLFVTLANDPDRLLLNTAGVFALAAGATPDDTRGSLGVAAADLDGDGRLDLLQGQGEAAFADKVQLASTAIAIDTVAPSIRVQQIVGTGRATIHASVHDLATPVRADQFQRVWLEADGFIAAHLESGPPPIQEHDMRFAGGTLWSAPALSGVARYRVCATDRRGNQACSPWLDTDPVGPGPDAGPGTGPDAGSPGMSDPGGCCDAGGAVGGSPALAFVVLTWVTRRRRQWRA